MKLAISVILLFFSICFGKSQNIVEVGAVTGATLMLGDYPAYSFDGGIQLLPTPGIGLLLRRPLSEKLAFRAIAYATTFKGDDRLLPRLFGQRTPTKINRANIELQLQGDYGFWNFYLGNQLYTMTAFGGLGLSKTTVTDTDVNFDCPVVNLVIPLGLSLRTTIAERWNLFMQGETGQGTNDCLDGFVDQFKSRDVYVSFKVGFTYNFDILLKADKSIGCPASRF